MAKKQVAPEVTETEKINNEIKSKCFLMGDKLYGIELFERDIATLKNEVRELILKRKALEVANGPQNPK